MCVPVISCDECPAARVLPCSLDDNVLKGESSFMAPLSCLMPLVPVEES